MWCVKSPLTFFHIQLKMRLRNTVKFTHMMLRLVPEILDTIDVILSVFFVDKLSAVVDSVMLKIARIQYIVAGEIISVDNAVRVNF